MRGKRHAGAKMTLWLFPSTIKGDMLFLVVVDYDEVENFASRGAKSACICLLINFALFRA
jgi:hypothetical protein